MNLKSLLKNIICAMVIAEILTVTVAIAKNNNTQKLSQGKQIMLAESTVIEFNEGVGENLTAKLNTETGELTITGTGNMTSWTYSNKAPWYSYKDKIKTVVIEEGVTSIGNYAFDKCSSLSEINIPEGVTSIGDSAFDGCSSLSQIDIPNSVTSIGPYAFDKCSSLSEINIPEGVTSIGMYAFFGCSSLSKIELPSSVTSIGREAFSGCSSLSKIELPSSVTSIGFWAFSGCSSLSEIEVEENNKNYSSINGILFNKEKTEIIIYPAGKKETSYNIPEGVTSIGSSAFSGCRSLSEINIPEGVTSIESWAFHSCSSLSEINIPEGVTSIGMYAFFGCSSLSKIELPSSVTSIGECAFYLCSSLSKIELPSSVTSIGKCAFSGCSSLSEIELPSSVTSIGDSAFFGCSSLSQIQVEENNKNYSSINGILFNKEKTEIIKYPAGKKETSYNIPEGVTSIGDSAFYECSSLSEINIPEGVTSIGSRAFYKCSSLSQINIPEGVTSIESWAFAYCESLSQINIPEGVTSIGSRAFYKCSSLSQINIPEGVTSIESWAFAYCGSLSQINIPEGVTSIGSYAFYGCSSLSEINIPEGVTSIGDDAFYGCSSLSKIELPSSVTSIGMYVFSGCSSLTINCRSNSYAKEYAVSNNINYTEINPEIISVTGNTEEWTHENVTLKVEAKDTMYGLAEEAYSFDGGTTWQKENTKTYSQNTEGIVIKVKAKDGAIATYGATINITKIANEHVATGEFIIDKEATCEEPGSKYKHCVVKNCNEKLEITEILALGHNYKDGICTICGEKETIFINTSRYKIENEKYIRNVKLNTTIEEFKKNIKEEYAVKITKDEKNVTTGIIGTGTKVTVSKNGENIGEYIVVVTGDLTGDGKLQNGDLIKLVRHKVELITLEEPYKLAGDINGDGKISDSDIIKLARVLVSLEQL